MERGYEHLARYSMEEAIFLESIDVSVEEGLDFSLDADLVSDSESQVLRDIYEERDSR